MQVETTTHDHHTTTAAARSSARRASGRPGEPAPDAIGDGAIYRDLGLTDDEYDYVVARLGRRPTWSEIGMVSVMWSEHCSYRSSKPLLRRLPTTGAAVLQGPGGNAGIVDIGDGRAVAFKVESHNHPSAIEPYEGAATGVGGIVRDVLAMGARPIALLNSLRFGPIDGDTRTARRNRRLLAGVTAGIGGYGNCIGVPTIGGEVAFAESYTGSPLVNAMCIGMLETHNAAPDALAGVGNPIYAIGASTGRDGIHGATFASTEDPGHADRAAVQVGDPFTGKLLIEGIHALLDTGAVAGLQDMGAAGLTSSLAEMAARGGLGLELRCADVPRREAGMSPYELLLSESQERMIAVITAGMEHVAEAALEACGLGYAEVGRVIEERVFRVLDEHGDIDADIPVALLVDEAPMDERHVAPSRQIRGATETELCERLADVDPGTASRIFTDLLASSDLCSRRWISDQFDHQVQGNTASQIGADGGIVRIGDNTGIAVTLDGNARYTRANPQLGGAHSVAEAARNLACAGARPLGATDCLNFSSPDDPRIFRQLSDCVDGMAAALEALDVPIVSGNVSLYNHADGVDVDPTPVIGMVGRVDRLDTAPGVALSPGATLLLLGGGVPQLSSSVYALRIHDVADHATCPEIDLRHEARLHQSLHTLVADGIIQAAHDVSDGGVVTTLAEMAIAGSVGLTATLPGTERLDCALWGESAGRVVVAVDSADVPVVQAVCEQRRIPVHELGSSGGDAITIAVEGWDNAVVAVPVGSAAAAHAGALAEVMG